MIVILWIVIGVLTTDCVGCIGQQARRGEQALIDRLKIDERFQCRSTTARLHRAVDLRHVVILGANHGTNRARRVFEHNNRYLRDVMPI